MESNSLMYPSFQAVHSIELIFGMYNVGHPLAYCVDFGEFKKNNFLQESKKILTHHSLWSQIIRSMLVHIQCFRLSSNFICAM